MRFEGLRPDEDNPRSVLEPGTDLEQEKVQLAMLLPPVHHDQGNKVAPGALSEAAVPQDVAEEQAEAASATPREIEQPAPPKPETAAVLVPRHRESDRLDQSSSGRSWREIKS